MKNAIALAVLGVVFSVPALGCDKPTAPASIPDGKTASKEEMLAAKKEVDAFKQSMDEYLSCEKNSRKADDAQQELIHVADRFNVQVRAFKAKS